MKSRRRKREINTEEVEDYFRKMRKYDEDVNAILSVVCFTLAIS